MCEPTYHIIGIGNNETIDFDVFDVEPPAIGSYFYLKQLDVDVYITNVEKIKYEGDD